MKSFICFGFFLFFGGAFRLMANECYSNSFQEQIQNIQNIQYQGCSVAQIESFEGVSSCLDGIWDALYRDNRDLLISIGSLIKAGGSRVKQNASQLCEIVKDPNRHPLRRLCAIGELCSPIWLLVRPSDREAEKIKTAMTWLKDEIVLFYEILKSGSKAEADQYLELKFRMMDQKIFGPFKESLQEVIGLMAAPEMAEMRTQLVCGVVSSIGLGALVTFFSAGAGSGILAKNISEVVTKLNKLKVLLGKIFNLNKFGSIDAVLDYVRRTDNSLAKKTNAELLETVMACGI